MEKKGNSGGRLQNRPEEERNRPRGKIAGEMRVHPWSHVSFHAPAGQHWTRLEQTVGSRGGQLHCACSPKKKNKNTTGAQIVFNPYVISSSCLVMMVVYFKDLLRSFVSSCTTHYICYAIMNFPTSFFHLSQSSPNYYLPRRFFICFAVFLLRFVRLFTSHVVVLLCPHQLPFPKQ